MGVQLVQTLLFLWVCSLCRRCFLWVCAACEDAAVLMNAWLVPTLQFLLGVLLSSDSKHMSKKNQTVYSGSGSRSDSGSGSGNCLCK